MPTCAARPPPAELSPISAPWRIQCGAPRHRLTGRCGRESARTGRLKPVAHGVGDWRADSHLAAERGDGHDAAARPHDRPRASGVRCRAPSRSCRTAPPGRSKTPCFASSTAWRSWLPSVARWRSDLAQAGIFGAAFSAADESGDRSLIADLEAHRPSLAATASIPAVAGVSRSLALGATSSLTPRMPGPT